MKGARDDHDVGHEDGGRRSRSQRTTALALAAAAAAIAALVVLPFLTADVTVIPQHAITRE